MSRKKILVIYPGPLLPTVMASQLRVKVLVQALSKVHNVDLVTLERQPSGLVPNKTYEDICGRHFPILVPNHENSRAGRVLYSMLRRLAAITRADPSQYYYAGLRRNQRTIQQYAEIGNYDLIHLEYYFSGTFVDRMLKRPVIALDTHCVNHLNTELELRNLCSHYENNWWMKRRVARERELERRYTELCDLIISIAPGDRAWFEAQYPDKRHITIPTGLDLSPFTCSAAAKAAKPTILFYGGLSSYQNVSAFEVLWEAIMPGVRKEVPNVHLRVVGANPAQRIMDLVRGSNVEVTGFVENPAEAIRPCHMMLLPMRCGTGFRTRLVEVMAAGVPVVGTHIAVDSIGFDDGIHGFVSDDCAVLARRTVELLRDARKRDQMGKAAQEFVVSRYSIENTYSRLADYYGEWDLTE